MKVPFARVISLNITDFILLRMRDQDQAENLARQIYGKRHAEDVLEVYRGSVLAKPYGYMLMNLSLLTPNLLQIRSGIFGEPPCLGKYIMMLLP